MPNVEILLSITTDHLQLLMAQSPLNSFSIALGSQDACGMAELGFERLNRKPNFSSKETQFIIDMVRKFKLVLSERSLDSGTNERKRGIWQMICDGVNEITPGVYRSVEEIRKRWQNLNCTARKDAAKMKKFQIEGLAPPQLSNVSMQILGLADDHEDIDENGPNSDLVIRSMKIEIDLATDASDDNSLSDFPNLSELSESPQNDIKNDNSLTSVHHTQAQRCLGASSAAISEQSTRQSPETISSDSNPSKSTSHTIASNFPRSKVLSNGPPSHNSLLTASSTKTSPEVNQRLPSTSSNQTGSIAKNFKTQMCNDIEILNDIYTTNSSSNNARHHQDGLKKRRVDDQYFRLQEELLANERDSVALERDKVQLEREKLNMEQEQLAVELQKVLMEKEKLNLEKEVEQEKLRMGREKILLELQQERQKLALEREKLELARDQEKSRLKLDQEKLDIEKEKIALEQEKLALEIRYWRRRLLQTQSTYDSNAMNGSS